LFSFPEGATVLLKYKDEEGDMVTISSNEELLFAIELFSGSVLRLVLLDQNTEDFGRHLHGRGHHHPCHKGGKFGPRAHSFHGGRGYGCHKGGENRGAFWREKWIQKLKDNPEHLEKIVNRLSTKRDNIREKVESRQCEPHHQQHLEFKLNKIESRLAHLQDLKKEQNNTPVSECSPSGPTETEQQQPCHVPSHCSNKDELLEALRQGKERREQLVIELSAVTTDIEQKKSEIKSCRFQARSGGCQKEDIHQRIAGLKEGIGMIRQNQQQKKCQLQEHDANVRNLRCQFRTCKKEKHNDQ